MGIGLFNYNKEVVTTRGAESVKRSDSDSAPPITTNPFLRHRKSLDARKGLLTEVDF